MKKVLVKGKLGKNILHHYEWVNTRQPQSGKIKKELSRYAKDVWVYWDPKARASHAVTRDYQEDLKAWYHLQEGNASWVQGMDNLSEQISDAHRELLKKPPVFVQPAYTPGNCTDLCCC